VFEGIAISEVGGFGPFGLAVVCIVHVLTPYSFTARTINVMLDDVTVVMVVDAVDIETV
jgi:hypothetical protein